MKGIQPGTWKTTGLCPIGFEEDIRVAAFVAVG
jgi:hypothetical protein